MIIDSGRSQPSGSRALGSSRNAISGGKVLPRYMGKHGAFQRLAEQAQTQNQYGGRHCVSYKAQIYGGRTSRMNVTGDLDSALIL